MGLSISGEWHGCRGVLLVDLGTTGFYPCCDLRCGFDHANSNSERDHSRADEGFAVRQAPNASRVLYVGVAIDLADRVDCDGRPCFGSARRHGSRINLPTAALALIPLDGLVRPA